jgi:ATP-binding cassette subfamily B multidrug efflux pump
MRSLRRLLVFMRPYRLAAILSLLALAGSVSVELIIPRLIQNIIDRGVVAGDLHYVIRTTVVMLSITLFSAGLALVNNVLSIRAGQSFGADLRQALYSKIQSLSFGNLDRLETGQLLVRLTSDVNLVHAIVQMFLRILTRAPLLMIGSIALMVATSWQLALVLLVTFPLVSGLIWYFGGKGRRLFDEVQRRLDRMNTVMQENLAGVRVVKAFVRSDFEDQRFEAANLALTQQTARVMKLFSVVMPTMQFILNLGMVAVIWMGGVRVLVHGMTVGQVVAFSNYLQSASFPLIMLGNMVAQVAAAEASAHRILGVLDTANDVQESEQASARPLGGRVVFDHVTFSYDGANAEPVLKDVNLVAEPGESVAILGATGAGKSSLVGLIPRFYDVTEGRILLDGTDVRDLSLGSLRTQVGVALQEAVLFSGTVRDNIRYGRPEATDEEVIAAAKAAQIHDYIMSLPAGYDTLIGQRGVNLSGGQKQRLAIARALLVNPRILILDDSTSAVDVETEAKIEEALAGLPTQHTRFVIAQRISTVLKADKIIVLDRGRVAAVGTHRELMASSPIYREIYESQLGNGVIANGSK